MATQEVTFLTDPYTWTTLSFVLVVGFGGFKAVKGISAALDKRAQKISDELDEAQRLREEAQELLANYQAKQREALKEADEIRAHAKVEADRMLESAQAELKAALKRREQQADAKIKAAEASMVAELRDRAASLAIATATEIISSKLDDKASLALVDKATAEIEKLN